MRILVRAGLGALVVVVLAGCSGTAPVASSPAAASAPAASAAPSASAAGSAATSGGAGCAASTDAPTVEVTIADFAFDPGTAQATVGDVVGWTNEDSAPHSAVVDGKSCETETLTGGQSGALVFDQPGTYAYHCGVHPQMKGTVEVSG